MKQYFNTIEIVEYKGNKITVNWSRNAYDEKTDSRLFPENFDELTKMVKKWSKC